MERPKIAITKENSMVIFDHIFANGMGNPIIFTAIPTDDGMKANTCGKVKDATDFMYIKFADGVIKKVALLAL